MDILIETASTLELIQITHKNYVYAKRWYPLFQLHLNSNLSSNLLFEVVVEYNWKAHKIWSQTVIECACCNINLKE